MSLSLGFNSFIEGNVKSIRLTIGEKNFLSPMEFIDLRGGTERAGVAECRRCLTDESTNVAECCRSTFRNFFGVKARR